MHVSEGEQETPYWLREAAQEREKAMIARAALERVEEGDRIILDASTTAWHMARRLRDRPLTVVTNSIRVALTLAKLKHVEVMALGGQLLKRSLSFTGPHAEETLKHFHVDKLFLSCAGVDVERGVSDLSAEQASVRRAMIEQSDHRFLLVDHSKFGVRALSATAGFEPFEEVITDSRTDEGAVRALRAKGLHVTVIDVSVQPVSGRTNDER